MAKAKADHDNELAQKQTNKQPHEISSEELRASKCPPQREHYENSPSVVGKDVEAVLGMRVRLGEGHISQGIGTMVEIFDEDQAGTCAVIWDSDECHTRPLHEQLGNRHVCRIGKNSDYDLVLAENSSCPDFEIREHVFVHNGVTRKHLEVIRKCVWKPAEKSSPSAETHEADDQ